MRRRHPWIVGSAPLQSDPRRPIEDPPAAHRRSTRPPTTNGTPSSTASTDTTPRLRLPVRRARRPLRGNTQIIDTNVWLRDSSNGPSPTSRRLRSACGHAVGTSWQHSTKRERVRADRPSRLTCILDEARSSPTAVGIRPAGLMIPGPWVRAHRPAQEPAGRRGAVRRGRDPRPVPQPLRDQPVVRGIRAFREGGQVVVEEPGVAVERSHGGGVPEHPLHRHHTGSAHQPEARCGVPEVVGARSAMGSSRAGVGPVKRKNCTSLHLNV